jgi:hypothetical protein
VENICDGLSPGDKVKVEWGFRPIGVKECYKKEGIVEQITPYLIAIRTRAGYVFCVNHYHIRTGTTVKKIGARAA